MLLRTMEDEVMEQTLYYGGPVITMEGSQIAEAVLTENGIIRFVGKIEDIADTDIAGARLVDLKGKALLPAFIDSHSHITALATTMGMACLSNANSFQEIVDILKKSCNQLKEGQWLIGFGYDHNNLQEKQHPDKTVLDQISTEIPILISHVSGHMGVANTMALKEMEITQQSDDPVGGKIGRNEDGSFNGYLEENAFFMGSSKIPSPTIEQQLNQLKQAEEVYLKNGITTVQDGLTKQPEWSLLQTASAQKQLTVDVVAYPDYMQAKELVQKNKLYVKNYLNHLKIGGYKLILDGSPQGKTAWMSQPYEGESSYCGYPAHTDQEVLECLSTALEEKLQVLVHCNGDAAAQQLIDQYRLAKEQTDSTQNIRPVMIHAQTVRKDQLKQMAELDMIASFFIAHTYYWGDIHCKNLGQRAMSISPVQSAIENHVVYTFHQDTPVLLPNMMETVWCAVNRISKQGIVIGQQEKISVLDALKGITINAAYQYGEERKKGSIKMGKRADFVILDRNPLNTPKLELNQIQILQTIKDGIPVYQSFQNKK